MTAMLLLVAFVSPLYALSLQTSCSPLSVGSQLGARIEQNKIHCYSVAVTRNSWISASLDQRGVDLWAAIRLPDGTEQHFDTRWHGKETFSFGGQAKGTYLISIGVVPDGPAGGEYTLQLCALEGEANEEIQANQARLLFTGVKRRLVNPTRRDVETAALDSARALELFRASRDEVGQAQALNALGYLRNYAADREGALKLYAEALEIWSRTGDLSGLGETHSNCAASLRAQGKKAEAFEEMRLALDFRKRAGDRAGQAFSLGNLGNMEFQYGHVEEAIKFSTAAIQIYESAGMPKKEVPVFSTLAACYRATGQYQDALALFRRALPLSASVDRRGFGYLLNSEGRLQDDLGNLDQALGNFRRALLEARKTGDPVLEAGTLNNLANVYLARNQISRAMQVNDAIRLLPNIDKNPGENLKYQLSRARICERQGDLARAKEIAQLCLTNAASLENISIEGAAALELGEIEFRRKDFAAAIGFFNSARALWRRVADRNDEAFALVALAKTKRAAGQKTTALEDVEAAVELIETLRTRVSAESLRASLMSSRYQPFKLWIDLLMENGKAEEALSASERVRARILLDLLSEERGRVHAGVDAASSAKLAKLTTAINGEAYLISDLPAGASSASKIAAFGKDVADLVSERRRLEEELVPTNVRFSSLTNPQTLNSKQIQLLLDGETALLEYSLDTDHGYSWLVTNSEVSVRKIAGQAVIARAVVRLGRAVMANQSLPCPAARRLSSLILANIELPKHIRRLVVVAEGPLESVPFAILPARNGLPLLESVEVVRLPSASVLAEMRKQPESPATRRRVFIVADPVFGDRDPRLQTRIRPVRDFSGKDEFARLYFSGEEARYIAAQAGARNALLLSGFDARREVLLSPEARNYKVHHLATHLVLDSRRPDLSRIVFSLRNRQGLPINGYLLLHDIYNLDLSSDLVVLSACKSGLGFQMTGEGMIGFTRGMLLAGARATLASLWPVNDQATAELMKLFYRELLRNHRAPAAALRLSQLAMLRQPKWRQPYFWAGFSLYGDWRQ